MYILKPPQALLSHHAAATRLQARGWTIIGPGSTGTYVLGKPSSRLVYKIGDDPGLIAFADSLRTVAPSVALPRIFGITDPSYPWAGICCERLRPMSPPERQAWELWVVGNYQQHGGNPTTDLFNIASVLHVIRAKAIMCGLGLDILNPNNMMVRLGTAQVVASDPLN